MTSLIKRAMTLLLLLSVLLGMSACATYRTMEVHPGDAGYNVIDRLGAGHEVGP